MEKKVSVGLDLKEVDDWRVRGIHWVGMGSCTDSIVVLPEEVTHIGYKEEGVWESDCFDTQHIRSGWRIYHEPEPLDIPSTVKEIHIGANVKNISEKAFWRLPEDAKLFVDELNPHYMVKGNNRIVKKEKN